MSGRRPRLCLGEKHQRTPLLFHAAKHLSAATHDVPDAILFDRSVQERENEGGRDGRGRGRGKRAESQVSKQKNMFKEVGFLSLAARRETIRVDERATCTSWPSLSVAKNVDLRRIR